ncbi:MAG: flagellar assembly protein FliH [Candidatus Atribacteria bacterium]|nr:flagellar assembly protein FliH [Candidatus Atribacteria bacterium]
MKSLFRLYKKVEILPEQFLVGEKDDEIRTGAREEEKDINEEERFQEEISLIIEEAKRKAQQILEEAEKGKKNIEDKAKKEGWEEGIKIGKEEVQKEWQKKVALWEQELREIYNYREEMVEKLKEPLLELSFAIARKIIGREAEREPFVELMIERALKKLSNRERVILRVSQEEYGLVREIREELMRRIDGIDYLEIQEDHRLKRGECLVETTFGSIDARVDTQLENIREELLRVLEEGSDA